MVSWSPENERKNLNNFMSSWPICMIFGSYRSAWYVAIQFILYNRRDQTTPSYSAGQLKNMDQSMDYISGIFVVANEKCGLLR